MLDLCEVSRSTFNSWRKAGLDLVAERGAYGLDRIVAVVVLASARKYLTPKDMAGAWRSAVKSGADERIARAGRSLEADGRFDLVIESEHAFLSIACSEEELVEAVRHPGAPRPVVVVDLADRIRHVVETFDRIANETPRPQERGPGRPRSADRDNVRHLRKGGAL